MSMGSLFSIARSALLTHQRALSVTAHNIANAQTTGFSRQRLNLIPAIDVLSNGYIVGSGVADTGVSRARDTFFDATYRREAGLLGSSQMMRDFLEQIEAAVAEPSDTGVAAALDGMFQAFGDLANDPSSGPNRELVRSAARNLASRLNEIDGQLSRISEDALVQLRSDVDEVNQLTSQIAQLNEQILAARGQNQSVPDLEDRRDLLIDQLSQYVSVRVVTLDDGTLNVQGGNATLVSRTAAATLEVSLLDGGGFGINVAGHDTMVDPQEGSLDSLVGLLNDRIPEIRGRMDAFTEALVTEVNAIHRTGTTADGRTGVDFFDPASLTAGSIRLSDDVLASADAIAAGVTGEAGDNQIALALAGLKGQQIASLGDVSLRDFYIQHAAMVGAASKDALQSSSLHTDLLDQADLLRMSISGVSVDEEMVTMISQQQAYTAAARLLQIADEVIQDLLDSV